VIAACLRRFLRLTPSRIEYNRRTRSRNDAHGEKDAHGIVGICPSCTHHIEVASLRLIKERRDGEVCRRGMRDGRVIKLVQTREIAYRRSSDAVSLSIFRQRSRSIKIHMYALQYSDVAWP